MKKQVTQQERRYGRWKACPDAAQHDVAPWWSFSPWCSTCGYPEARPRPRWYRGKIVTSNPIAQQQASPALFQAERLEAVARYARERLVPVLVEHLDAAASELAELRREVYGAAHGYLRLAKGHATAGDVAELLIEAARAVGLNPRTLRALNIDADNIGWYLRTMPKTDP